jgi:hypothetical protein
MDMTYVDKIKEVYTQVYPYTVEVSRVGPGMAWCDKNLEHGQWGYFTVNEQDYCFCFKNEEIAFEFGLRFM